MKIMKNLLSTSLVGTVLMVLLAILLLSVGTFAIRSGWLPIESGKGLIYAVHLLSVFVGCVFCVKKTKEKKGMSALLGMVLLYVLLLFTSVVVLDCDLKNVLACVIAGSVGCGAALIVGITSKSGRRKRRVKVTSR